MFITYLFLVCLTLSDDELSCKTKRRLSKITISVHGNKNWQNLINSIVNKEGENLKSLIRDKNGHDKIGGV